MFRFCEQTEPHFLGEHATTLCWITVGKCGMRVPQIAYQGRVGGGAVCELPSFMIG